MNGGESRLIGRRMEGCARYKRICHAYGICENPLIFSSASLEVINARNLGK